MIIMVRKTGTVVYASPGAQWWTVQVGGPASLEIYFLHRTFIKEGTECGVGYVVEFTVGPPKQKGLKPCALDAVIVGKAGAQ
jgi:hypothetical protein